MHQMTRQAMSKEGELEDAQDLMPVSRQPVRRSSGPRGQRVSQASSDSGSAERALNSAAAMPCWLLIGCCPYTMPALPSSVKPLMCHHLLGPP